jgi:hypothetical protein
LTTLFNKLKPAGAQWPTNGAPLQDDDPLLEPTIGKGPLNPDGTPSDADTDQYRYQPDGRSRRRDNLPTTEDQLVELKHHVEQAREMTVLLVEAIEFTEASEVENDPIIRVSFSFQFFLLLRTEGEITGTGVLQQSSGFSTDYCFQLTVDISSSGQLTPTSFNHFNRASNSDARTTQ